MSDLINLNGANGADRLLLDVARDLAAHPPDARPLVGAELGIAYGGGVQAIGRLWRPVGGTIYGLDTFCGHPTHLATHPTAHEAICMDGWYGRFGTAGLDVAYQRGVLRAEGLDNVVLRPGLIDPNSLNDVPYLHYCLLDLDLIASMRCGWELARPRLAAGGYLCLHDCVPRGHIAGLWELYQEIVVTGEYVLVAEHPRSFLVVLRRQSCASY
jgi:hypothetical protein